MCVKLKTHGVVFYFHGVCKVNMFCQICCMWCFIVPPATVTEVSGAKYLVKLSVPRRQTPAGVSRASTHCRDFMDTPRGPEGMSGVPGTGGSTSSSSSSSTSSSSFTSMRPEEGPKEKQEAPEAEYLSSRCVLFTYYQGDISSVVDEHFSRALSSYMDGEGKRRPTEQGTGRNFSLLKWPFVR